jgi:hypothetical protein
MKTEIIPLLGDPVENFFQLGMREKNSFFKIEERVRKLLSTNSMLTTGHDIINRAKILLKRREETLFIKCLNSYSQGLGVETARYLNFLSLFDLAAHYGQVYPELKSLLPGCTSVFQKDNGEITHTRLLDFPLIGLFEEVPRLYYWQPERGLPILSYSCEGLAPLFFQGIHGAGISFAVHHKPGKNFFEDGESIFQIIFDSVFEGQSFHDVKKELKKKNSLTKWGILLLDKSGSVFVIDIDGPSQNNESYSLHESSPLIFTNIPILHQGSDALIRFSEDRSQWVKDRLRKKGDEHILDKLTDIEEQKLKNWIHPSATLSTIGAWHINLTKGLADLKEGPSALTSSDKILRMHLGGRELETLKEKAVLKPFEISWKRASLAQSAFDQGDYDVAYHELQMAYALMPHPIWKEIFAFYLCIWDFKFITSTKELSGVYKKVKTLKVPGFLQDQWVLFIMRLEKKLDLAPTVTDRDISQMLRPLFQEEKLANKPVFATWMKLIYPRMEILDVIAPHQMR